jgi:hypothetical protein
MARERAIRFFNVLKIDEGTATCFYGAPDATWHSSSTCREHSMGMPLSDRFEYRQTLVSDLPQVTLTPGYPGPIKNSRIWIASLRPVWIRSRKPAAVILPPRLSRLRRRTILAHSAAVVLS